MKLAQRKLLVWAGGVAGVIGLLVIFVIMPVNAYKASMEDEVRSAEAQKVKLLMLEQEYTSARGEAAAYAGQFKSRKPDFTLFGFLENLASRDKVRANIEYMRPSVKKVDDLSQEEIVDLRLSNVSLQQLTTYLYHIETAPEAVRVTRFVLRSHDDRGLDADLVISALTSTSRS